MDNIDPTEILLTASKIRHFETALLEEFSLGTIRGTIHTCIGQEYFPVVLFRILKTSDLVFGGHRAHGLYLAKTDDYKGLACEIMDKEGALCKGVGGSQHLIANNFFTNGIQGGMWPIAVGASETLKLDNVSVIVAGDGSLGEGATYESMNIASLLNLPTLFVIEDNGIAQSSLQENYLSGTIENRFKAFNIPVFFADSHDLTNLIKNVKDSVSYTRDSRLPAALIVKSYRLSAHSKGDDNRSKSAIKELYNQDLINKELDLNEEFLNKSKNIYKEFKELIESLRKIPSNSYRLQDYKIDSVIEKSDASQIEYTTNKKLIKHVVSQNLINVLDKNKDAIIIGEDIESQSRGTESIYGGAFGVTAEVSKTYFDRVINFPISEQGILGFAIGRSLMGKATICEIMFADFSTLIIDQIRQHASKIVSMYGVRVKLPLLVRIVSGGRKGYGPTHSQNYENLFLGIPNVVVAAINRFIICTNFYSYLISLEMPCIVVENKDLYIEEISVFESKIYEIDLPKNFNDAIRIYDKKYKLRSATVITYGNAASILSKVIDSIYLETEQLLDIYVLNIISPTNLKSNQNFLESIAKTKKLIIVEETLSGTGVFPEVLSELGSVFQKGIQLKMIGGSGDIGASLYSETQSLIDESRVRLEIIKFLEDKHV
jgi:2-oxoisovalerate dehydrogenase E1 component